MQGPEQNLEPETEGESERGKQTETSDDGDEPEAEEAPVTAGEEQKTE